MKNQNDSGRDHVSNISFKCEAAMSDASSCLVQLDLVLSRLAKIYEADLNDEMSRNLHLRSLTHMKSILESLSGSRNLLKRAVDQKHRMRHGFTTAMDQLE